MSTKPSRSQIKFKSLRIDEHDLQDVELSGVRYGPEIGTAPVFVVIGGLTADPWPFGNGEDKAGWWCSLVGKDLIDPECATVLCPEWPGNGSHFRGVDDPQQRIHLSVQGLADLVAHWLEGIGCHCPVTFVGASLGALVGFALAQRHPERVARLVSVSAGLRPDGWGTATRHLQRELVRDGLRNGDVATGMARARQLGMLTYRGRHELDTRFEKLSPEMSVPPVAKYLDEHGKRFAERFPVATFLLLSEAIDRCSFGDSPGALRKAVSTVKAEVTVVGVPGDQLFPWHLQEELHRELQAAGASSSLWKLDSEFGHDAFLADQAKLADTLRSAGCFAERVGAKAQRLFEGVGTEPVRRIGLGLIGCGTVGQGLLELLSNQESTLAERYAVRFDVNMIAVNDLSKERGPLAGKIRKTTNALELVADSQVDVVIEVAGGMALEKAVRAALASGKPVVSANKLLLAHKLSELGVLAQRTATPLFCEAAVCAAIPILRHLSHRADEVESLMAIANGTCNYLLTRLEQDEMSLDIALVEAQNLGLAEADPSADIDGHDAAAKLSILCYRAFGIWASPSEITTVGIRALCPADSDLAESMGFRIRHIAHASRRDEGFDLAVEPLLLPAWHLLASVEEEYNAVYLQCESAGDLSFFGKGAGALPTATALLADLINLAQENTMRWPQSKRRTLPTRAQTREHYLRISVEQHPGLERRIESLIRRAGLSVQNRAHRSEGEQVHVGMIVSASSDEDFAQAQQAVQSLARVASVLGLGVSQ